MEENTLVSFENADIINGENTVLFGVNFTVHAGDFVYIVGRVGSGKTSIIRTITAENPLGGGSAMVCGYDLSTIKTKEIPYLRRRIGIVFQDFQLLMDRSVEENLRFVLRSTGWSDLHHIDGRIEETLRSVGMERKLHKLPHQLSGGEQQRIAIARALLNSPELIVADEPTGNLDSETADGIMQLLQSINSQGTAVIMVTHNLALCEKYPGTLYQCDPATETLIAANRNNFQ